MSPNWTFIGAVFGGLAVVAGAFGAHALKAHLSPEALGWWQTGAQYHVVHAVAIVLTGLFAPRGRPRAIALAGLAFTSGIVLFSGSLYALALTDVRWLAAVTPVGGLLLLVGWIALAASAVDRT